jgi:hypothetical protein
LNVNINNFNTDNNSNDTFDFNQSQLYKTRNNHELYRMFLITQPTFKYKHANKPK